MKRILSLTLVILLALMMPVTVLNSCSEPGTENPADMTGGKSNDDDNGIDIIDNSAMDDLPDLDYEGYEFNILTRESLTFYNYLVKFDEKQEEYHSRGAFYDAFVVSKTSEDFERTSAVIEALNSESYIIVYPEYYDCCLKSRDSRDSDSEAMLELIFNSLVIDLGDTVWSGIAT